MNNNSHIHVKVDVSRYSENEELDLQDALLFEENGNLHLHFEGTNTYLHRCRDDADGCPVFARYNLEFPLYAIHYPDGGEDWTTQSIFDELNGIPVEQEEQEPVELTFTFVKEETVGDLSVTEAIQVTQVIR
ncbi:D-alanyl-D-alanine carboxypeptidase [Salmonella phage BPS17L1]|uniref:D-alanyl-D-alanine carboxypeptidase n=1 Tax=Salmonella phage BPS17L1 TaxID=2060122 RepID=A0A2I6PHR9_9CAUD|nr:D-alanyl-D-alanine carboxypeptidase [Salmonella phage BPS17L1]AUM59592.1 D-alanyl-D-alanine carboxypeptidase [Salmonella phage BPS17L1]